MMKKFLILAISIIFPSTLLAASFTASLSKDNISNTEATTLVLKLIDATPTSSPNLTKLRNDFSIVGQQRYTSVQVIQWEQRTTTTWKYKLLPLSSDDISIPPIEINTDHGTLSTKELPVSITERSKETASNAKVTEPPISLSVDAPKNNIYLNQPFIATLTINENSPTINVKLEESKSSNYTVEQLGAPKQLIMHDGARSYTSTEIKYLITPLVTGDIKLPKYTVSGQVEVPLDDNFNNLNPDDIFKHFGQININPGFGNYEPFITHSNDYVINIKEPVADISPWIVAKELDIQEQWQLPDKITEGSQISRTITINGKDATISNINAPVLANDGDGYKVYADAPQINSNPISSSIMSSYKQSFSIIATTTGNIKLPAVKIAWWNSDTSKKEWLYLPEKAFNILESSKDKTNATALSSVNITDSIENEASQTYNTNSNNYVIYLLISLILLLVIIIIVLAFIILNKGHKSPSQSKEYKRPYAKRIGSASSIEQLHNYLIAMLAQEYKLPANTPLSNVPQWLLSNNLIEENKIKNLESLFKAITSAKFNRGKADINKLKQELVAVLDNIKPDNNTSRSKCCSKDKTDKLNPR